MFVVAQFPLSDLRLLAPDRRGRLAVPDWTADDHPGDVFVRGFGPLAERNSGGIGGLVGERAFADFNRAVRFTRPIAYRQADWPEPILVRPWFRRFYFDGTIAGRFEFGFLVPDLDEYRVFTEVTRNGYDIAAVASTLAATPIVVRGVDLPAVETTLADAAEALAAAYTAATTQRSALLRYPLGETLGPHVAVGAPIVYIRVSDDRPAIVGRASRRIDLGEDGEVHIASVGYGARRVSLVAQTSLFGALYETGPERTIRVLFSHLNAFVFAASHLTRLDPAAGGGLDRDRLAAFGRDLLSRLQQFAPTGPRDDSDAEFAAAVRVFARAYAGRSADLAAELEAFVAEMRKPTGRRRALGYAKDLLDIIVGKLFEAGIRVMIKPEG
jgi:hypothetical protein